MKFVNRTGRDLTIFRSLDDATGELYLANGPPAKLLDFGSGPTVDIDGMPVRCEDALREPELADIIGLPAPEPGVIYIVAYPVEVAAARAGRRDCVRMGPARFASGKQTGAEGFVSSLLDFAA